MFGNFLSIIAQAMLEKKMWQEKQSSMFPYYNHRSKTFKKHRRVELKRRAKRR